jgi:hypothetical protein
VLHTMERVSGAAVAVSVSYESVLQSHIIFRLNWSRDLSEALLVLYDALLADQSPVFDRSQIS